MTKSKKISFVFFFFLKKGKRKKKGKEKAGERNSKGKRATDVPCDRRSDCCNHSNVLLCPEPVRQKKIIEWERSEKEKREETGERRGGKREEIQKGQKKANRGANRKRREGKREIYLHCYGFQRHCPLLLLEILRRLC